MVTRKPSTLNDLEGLFTHFAMPIVRGIMAQRYVIARGRRHWIGYTAMTMSSYKLGCQ